MMIQTEGLRRVFRSRKGEVVAVAGVDLAAAEGEIVGFLGPNGAGKTTTIRMLVTLLPPTAGARDRGRRRPAAPARRGPPPHRLRGPGRGERPDGHRPIGARAAGPALRGQPGCGSCRRRPPHRALRPHGVRRPPVGHVVGRSAAPARPGDRARASAEARLPRRAHHGARPPEQGQPLGRDPRPALERHDRPAHDALPRGGRRALRSAGDPRRWSHRRRGDAGRAEAPDRRRCGHRRGRRRGRARRPQAAGRRAVRPRRVAHRWRGPALRGAG